MRRIIAIPIAALLLSLGPLAAPAEADVRGPACADITGTGGGDYYKVLSNDSTLHLEIEIVQPLCKFATLTVHLSDSNGGSITTTYPGGDGFGTCSTTGTSCISFDHRFGSPPTEAAPANNPCDTTTSGAPRCVSVYLETTIGGHVADRAPNAGTFTLVLCNPGVPTTGVPGCDSPGGEYLE